MSTLLIGYGMLGRRIAYEFESRDLDIVVMDELDKVIDSKSIFHINHRVYSSNQLKSIFKEYKIHSIIIAAGVMSNFLKSSFEKAITKETQMINAIIDAVIDYKEIEKIIYLSSFAVYGLTKKIDENVSIDPVSSYGIIKGYNEKLLLQALKHNIVKIIRPVGVLGAIHGKSANWMSTVLCAIYYDRTSPSLINQLTKANYYVDVREVASFVYHINFIKSNFNVINIGNPENQGSKLLIDTINQVWDKKIQIPHNQLNQQMNFEMYHMFKKNNSYNLKSTLKYIGDNYE